MSTIITAISPIWKVLLVGLVLGAGLPAVFAFGLRASAGTVGADGSSVIAPNPAARVAGVLCFLVVALVVVAAIIVLASSKAFLAKFGLS